LSIKDLPKNAFLFQKNKEKTIVLIWIPRDVATCSFLFLPVCMNDV